MRAQTPSKRHPIAYFSLEFAVSQKLPIYSGGLGVLAGDVLKTAHDIRLPMVGVGILYDHGYFRQKISEDGEQIEINSRTEVDGVLTPITKKGKRLYVTVPMLDRTVYAKAWKYQIGSVTLYLINTNCEKNLGIDRDITRYLYGGDSDTRIKQEMILGIGGERLLFELGIHPTMYHLNEGHSAFCTFEITHHIMKETGSDFHTAFNIAQKRIVFTNHTLLPSGNDRFSLDKIKLYFTQYAKHLHIPVEDLLKKGEAEDKKKHFSMTQLAISMSSRINTVSKLHQVFARKVWPATPMPAITNGVHLPTWVHTEYKKRIPSLDFKKLDTISDNELWDAHIKAKKNLISFLSDACDTTFSERILTLVWARRFAVYKQPAILFSEVDTLKKLSQSAHGALQIIISGKAHPRDTEGKKLIKHIHDIIKKANLSRWVVFVPNYSLKSATYLVQGADVWLNTPIRGWEASGTSGMKAGANGLLQLSTRDGWVDEIDLEKVGWVLDHKNTAKDLYKTIEKEVLPLFYTFDGEDRNSKWITMMRASMKTIWKDFSAQRMLREYVEKLYIPKQN